MQFLLEKQSKSFFAGVLFLILLFFAGNVLLYQRQTTDIRHMLVAHDAAVASSLIKQGVSETVIAKAITSQEASQQGKSLLGKLGIQTDGQTPLLPQVQEIQGSVYMLSLAVESLFSLLLILWITLFLVKQNKLYEAAMDIVSRFTDGDFSTLLPQTSNGTLYQLFTKINGMATALQSKQETEKNIKIFLKNTVSDISHQLKTPLAALLMYNEIIQSEPDNEETVKAFSQKSVAALGRMEQLIKMLLKLMRLDAGSVEFQKNRYTISQVIAQSLENLTDRAKKECKEIRITGQEDMTICCDIQWTREAIGNIIKNALDHTPLGGVITICWEQTPLMVRIAIADNGNGIAEEDYHHIFKRFYRSQSSWNHQGMGLGLPLAKSIIEGQNGTISVESQRLSGAAFTLAFPLEPQ